MARVTVVEVELVYLLRAVNLCVKGIVLTMDNENIEQSIEPDASIETNEDTVGTSSEPTVESSIEPIQEPAPSVHGAAISKGGVDAVLLSACIYKNPASRKSLTIHHLQRRLNELGYKDAYADKDGWYGDLTRDAVAAYQKDNGIAVDGAVGIVDATTMEKLFAGDANVYIAE